MKVALIHNAEFPVKGYGGTERVVWWLAKGLKAHGNEVVLVADPKSQCPHASKVVGFDDEKNIKVDADVLHFFNTPQKIPEKPYLVTIEGNGQVGESFSINTVFVSGNHAKRHGASAFVYNGIDPDEYIFHENKESHLLFLAKAAWKVKNVKGAIRISRRAKRELRILGGSRFLFNHWGGIHWEGMVGGTYKAERIASASALLFPVLWHEPFGVAVIEALVSGTPVLASPYGSLPELVGSQVGRICKTEIEFIETIPQLSQYKAKDCRDWAVSKFHYDVMVESYLKMYEKVLKGQTLNTQIPRVEKSITELFSLN